MRQTTLRFSATAWALLEEEARREGVSVAQYVRDAALFRLAYELGRRGDLEDASEVMERLRAAASGE